MRLLWAGNTRFREGDMSENSSLSETFSKVNHARHILMDVAMLTMVLGSVATLVTTGIPVGPFDIAGMFASMHFPSVDNIMAIGDAFQGVADSAANGTWMTGNFMADPHELMHSPLVEGVNVDAATQSLEQLPSGTMDSLGWE